MNILFGVIALVIIFLVAGMSGVAGAAIPPPASGMPRRFRLFGVDLGDEAATLLETASRHGVDPSFLAALRKTENGGPGRELGVLSVSAPTLADQYDVAARSLANNEKRYTDVTGQSPVGGDGRLTPDFLRFFSARWAPVGASNDPTNLNSNHARNLESWYNRISLVAEDA